MSSETHCPDCNATIPVNPGYISWCECGWNLKPSFADDDEDGMVERIRIRIGDRMARDLFAKVSSAESLAPRMTFSKLLAYALAALVHLTSIALPVLGVWLLVSFWPNVVAIFVGLLCLGIGWVLRPGFGEPPEKVLDRAEFPKLYGLVDRIGDELGLPRIDGFVVDTNFNAFYTQAGIRNRRYIGIGLPLWAILEPQERVAVLAHEVAHGVERYHANRRAVQPSVPQPPEGGGVAGPPAVSRIPPSLSTAE